VDTLDEAEDRDESSAEVEQTKAQIEQTRAEMSGTIDAIKEKLSPQHLVQQAKESVREATIGRAQEVASNVVDSARHAANSALGEAERVMSSASSSAREAGSTVKETIQRNPLPSALIGIGLGWLLMNNRKHQSDSQLYTSRRYDDDYQRQFDSGYAARYDTQVGHAQPSQSTGLRQTLHEAKERAGDMAGQAQEQARQAVDRVQEKAGDIGSSIQHQAHRASLRGEQWMSENPLAVGAMALALGVAVGMAIPETAQERRLMGEARDRFVDRAQEAAQEVAQKVQSVAQEAMGTAREEARSQGLTQ
jgi:ElaB/YqjD/DUF883 family membrane-anchored ribosome-binding protein